MELAGIESIIGVDYHFRTREQIGSLDGNERFVVMDVRGDLQAVDFQELSGQLTEGNNNETDNFRRKHVEF
jgi:hypothetical protein